MRRLLDKVVDEVSRRSKKTIDAWLSWLMNHLQWNTAERARMSSLFTVGNLVLRFRVLRFRVRV